MEKVAEGEALVRQGRVGREPEWLSPVPPSNPPRQQKHPHPTPSDAAGRLRWCRLRMKRDEKFCMAGCGEKQRQSGWLRKKCVAVLAVPPSQAKGAVQLESLD